MARGVYTFSFDSTAATAAVDFFEVNSASGVPIEIVGLEISQTTEFGDAQDEMFRILVLSGHATSGSGGTTAAAPIKTAQGDASASCTGEMMNTTQASTGTTVQHLVLAANLRAGLFYKPIPEERLVFPGGTRLVFRLGAAPADSVSWTGTLTIKELS
jgi:hypothetical protein